MHDGPVNIHGWKPSDFEGEYQRRHHADRGLRGILQRGGGAIDRRVGTQRGGATARRLGIASPLGSGGVAGAGHLGRDAAGIDGRLCALRQWRQRHDALRHHPYPHQVGKNPLSAQARRPGSRDVARQQCGDDQADGRNRDHRHRQGGTADRTAQRGQDRHHPGFPRCLVRGLHRRSGDRRLGGQRQCRPHEKGDRRRAAGAYLPCLHGRRGIKICRCGHWWEANWWRMRMRPRRLLLPRYRLRKRRRSLRRPQSRPTRSRKF